MLYNHLSKLFIRREAGNTCGLALKRKAETINIPSKTSQKTRSRAKAKPYLAVSLCMIEENKKLLKAVS